MPTRRLFLTALFTLSALPALAHHGWRWTSGGDFELTGIIRDARLGNPHGLLTIDADGEIWVAEIGQPWRNARAGLEADMLSEGTEITLVGERSANADELRMKAEVVLLNGVRHVLYPERV